jgi:hypothetical protein
LATTDLLKLVLRVFLSALLMVCFYYVYYLELGGTFPTILAVAWLFYETFDLVLLTDLVDLRLTFDLIDS